MAKKLRQKRRTKTDNLTKKQQELERLGLEIKERKWNVSWLCKSARLAPLVTALIIFFGTLVGVGQWHLQVEQQRLETERLRTEKIANLKREFGSDSHALRIGAAYALAEYPKEAIHIFIESLKEENTVLTDAVKISLKQIGKDAVTPLTEELRNIQGEVTRIFAKSIQKEIQQLKGVPPLPEKGISWGFCSYISLDELLNKPLEDIRNKVKEGLPKTPDKEVELIITELDEIRSSRPQLKVARKNIVEVLASLIHRGSIEPYQLWGLDLSRAFLLGADLSNARLHYTNLSNSNLQHANLSNAILPGINLSDAFLVGANLAGADLSFANLSGANLSGADLTGVKGFREIEYFRGTNLRGVKGLSKEDLEYARSKGAIID